VGIPVIVNGDVDTPEKAVEVLRITGCDAIMLGRPALGRPWVFREMAHFLATGVVRRAPEAVELQEILLGHLEALYSFYGEHLGVRIARKHLGWYCREQPGGTAFRATVNLVESAAEQLEMTRQFLSVVRS
jgi:tRNA-dihydrouridine synthase B